MHLINSVTIEKVNCKIIEALKSDIAFVNEHFMFDWKNEMQHYNVFKLITKDEFIHGLISIQLQEDSLFLSLAELADINRGNKRHFQRVAGTLFAFASQIAIENSDGFMHMVAKTKLIHYYSETYGFTQIGNSQRMISTDINSKNLVTLFL